MMKSSNLSIALVALVITTFVIHVTGIHPGENGLLGDFPAEARQWSTVNYYSDNRSGYQTPAAVWTHLGFTP